MRDTRDTNVQRETGGDRKIERLTEIKQSREKLSLNSQKTDANFGITA